MSQTAEKGMLSTLYNHADQSKHPKTWKTLFFMGTALLWPVAWLIAPLWEAIYRPHSSELAHNASYDWRVARWLATGALVFGVLLGLSILTGGFFPAALSLSGLTLSLVWSGAIGLATAGLLALQDIMRDGVDFYEAYKDEKGAPFSHETTRMFSDSSKRHTLPRNSKAHWRYFARWLLPSLLFTALIVLSAGAIPAIAIGGAAGTSILATIMGSLSTAGITSMWAQVGIFAAGVFASLAVMHGLGTGSMFLSTHYSQEHRPKTRTFFRYLAKGLHFTGFLTVMALAFSNLAIFAAVQMGLMATPAATAPAAGAMAAATAPVVAESSWITILPIMAGLYTGISVALSALFGMLGVALHRKKKKASASDNLTKLPKNTNNNQPQATQNAAQITQGMPTQYYYSDDHRSPDERAYKAMIRKPDGTYQNATIEVNGQSKQLYLIQINLPTKLCTLEYANDHPIYCSVDQSSSFTIEKKPEDRPKEKPKKQRTKPIPHCTDEKDKHYYDEEQMLSVTVGNETKTLYKVVYIDGQDNWTYETTRAHNGSNEALYVCFDKLAKEFYAVDENRKHSTNSDPKPCQPDDLKAITDALREARAKPETFSTSAYR